jgi:lysophospholipase L1-like esterase
MYPERDICLTNRGISGNRVIDLQERWHDDTIRHQPDWLTIMIGINDLHGYLTNPEEPRAVPPARYRESYDWILSRTKAETDARIVLFEPFFFSISPKDTLRSRVLQLLPEYIGVVHDMADKHDTLLVETQRVCSYHLTFRDAEQFCPEPVHPYRSGHLIIALELLKTLQGV